MTYPGDSQCKDICALANDDALDCATAAILAGDCGFALYPSNCK